MMFDWERALKNIKNNNPDYNEDQIIQEMIAIAKEMMNPAPPDEIFKEILQDEAE